MNTSRIATINTPAALAVMAFALVVAALFGSPGGSTTAVQGGDGVSQVAGR